MNQLETVITNSGKGGFPTQNFLALEKKGLNHDYKPEIVGVNLSLGPLGILAFAAMSLDMKEVIGASYIYPRKLDGNPNDKVCVINGEKLKIETIEDAFRESFSHDKKNPIYELELGGSFVTPEAQGNGVYKELFKARLKALVDIGKSGDPYLTENGEPVSPDNIFVTLCSKGGSEENEALKKMQLDGEISFADLESIGHLSKKDVGKPRAESAATAHMAETLGMKLVAASSNNLGPIYAIKLTELLKGLPENGGKWGLPKPSILIDSQSSPALKGIEPEQRYYRLYLMGKEEDVVFTDYPVDPSYINYLKDVLHLPLPHFVQIANVGGQTLSENILAQSQVMEQIKKLSEIGYKLQFFNLNGDELNIAKSLSNPSYIKDLDFVAHLGTKDGFREFCASHGVPMPEGVICDSVADLEKAILSLNSDVIIKSSKGTGGKELGSNVTLSKAEFSKDGDVIAKAIASLMPAEPPYVVEKKLDLPEASLHIFIDDDGKVFIKPILFGQLAHDQSYVGGYYPNDFPQGLHDKIMDLAQTVIVPALEKSGATGFHCMDFLYDTGKNEAYFIEDNTRPGALDFIHHFVSKTVDVNFAGQPHAWYHKMIPLKELGIAKTSFEEISQVIGDLLLPNENGFGLVSNPDVLPYGYGLHLTTVAIGKGKSEKDAEKTYKLIVDRLKKHYGNK